MPERIAPSAERLFRTYGYEKTTVAEVARDAGISPAYLYRFYPSKAAICEEVCAGVLTRLTELMWQEARSTLDPAAKLNRLFVRLVEENTRLLFEEERLLDIVRINLEQRCPAVDRFLDAMTQVARFIIEEGVLSGQFRSPHNIDDRAKAVAAVLALCSHPVLLHEARHADPIGRARLVASLAIDGLRI